MDLRLEPILPILDPNMPHIQIVAWRTLACDRYLNPSGITHRGLNRTATGHRYHTITIGHNRQITVKQITAVDIQRPCTTRHLSGERIRKAA